MLVNILISRIREGEELRAPCHASAAATRDDRLPYSRQLLLRLSATRLLLRILIIIYILLLTSYIAALIYLGSTCL